MKKTRRFLALLLILALILPMIPPVHARGQQPQTRMAEPLARQPEGTDRISVQAVSVQQHPSKEEIAAKWAEVTSATTLFAAEPSITAPHVAGSLTEEFLETGLTYLNYVRFVAGLPAVTLDSTLNEDAQHGAVVLAAIDELTHTPSQPADMEDAFYERGYDATSSSNISARWGYGDLTTMLKSAVEGCMHDNGSIGNLTTVGHRRWLLNPTLGKVGFGYAESATDWSYIVTKVFDRSGAGCSYDFISWPVAGNHPTNLFHAQNPWSVTLNSGVFQTVSAESVKITVTRESDGTVWTFDGTTGEPNIDNTAYYTPYIAPYLTVNNQWYGLPNCIIFHPGTDNAGSYEGVYQVKITGICYTDGTAAEIEYEVNFFDINSVGCAHSYTAVVTEPTCQAQGYTTYTCANCGDSYVSDYTDPVDHVYEDGKCIWCGETDAVASGTCGDNLTWILDKYGLLTISGEGAMTDYTSGNAPWYRYRSQIRYMMMEGKVTTLGSYACYGLTGLQDVALAESLERIGDAALAGTALVYVYIPSKVTQIGQEVFSGCSSLAYISVAMDNTAFSNDDDGVLLTKDQTRLIRCPQAYDGAYVIPGTVEVVAEKAFDHCVNLTEVTIPGSVKELERHAFCACTALETVHLNEGLETVSQEAFMLCSLLKGSLTIPASVTAIGDSVFDMTELTELRFLGDMPEFGNYAFSGISLTVYYPADNATWTEEKIDAIKGLSTFVPYGINEEMASGTCGDNLTWKLADGVLTISGTGDMYDYTEGTAPWYGQEVTRVVLEEGITSIGDYAFVGTAMTELTIPGTVSAIGSEVFAHSDDLEHVYFVGDAPIIAEDAFTYLFFTAYYPYQNESWTEDKRTNYSGNLTWEPYCPDGGYPCDEGAHVPGLQYSGSESGFCKWCGIPCRSSNDTIWAIEEDGTMYVYGTGEMYAHDTNWKAYADRVTALVVKEGVTGTIHAFDQFVNLVSVSLPEGITLIEQGCFAVCTSLKQINIPGTVTEIGSGAFTGCTSLTELYLPASVQYWGGRPCDGCTALTGIWVDEESPYFTNDACGVLFSKDMTRLEAFPGGYSGHYTIPETVTYIEWGAFSGSSKLAGVTLPGGITELQPNVFDSCTALKTITIPASVTYLWYEAFRNCTGLEAITFEGNAPAFLLGGCFQNVTATAYYPAGNDTWTADVMQNYGGTITWVPYGEEEYYVKWYSGSTSLNGTIDLNMYVLLSKDLVSAPDTFVRFTFENRVVDVPMAEATASTLEDGTIRYRFSCELFAKQIADTAVVQVMKGNTPVGDAVSYSAMQYCINQIKKADAATVALCKAMLNYGAAAQQYFNYNTDNLANASLSEADRMLPDVDASAYKHSVTGSEDGIKARSATLMLESEVKVRVYFTLTGSKTIDAYTFTIDGKAVTPKYNDKGWYVETDGIAAKDLEKMFEVKVGGVTVYYGALSYVNSKHATSDALEASLARALFCYYQAAEALLG